LSINTLYFAVKIGNIVEYQLLKVGSEKVVNCWYSW